MKVIEVIDLGCGTISIEFSNDIYYVKINLEKPITPDVLGSIRFNTELDFKGGKGVIITGRAPIWLYCFLCHKFHPAPWIGVNDPRLGVVVIQSHVPEVEEGEVL